MAEPVHNTHLDDAYFAAIYTVELAVPISFAFAGTGGTGGTGEQCVLKVAAPWAIITAFNPGSRPLSPEENQARDGALLARLRELHPEGDVHHTVSRDAAGRWTEQGWLVERAERAAVLDLARRFGQRATVYAEADRVGLLFTDTHEWVVRPIRAVPLVP